LDTLWLCLCELSPASAPALARLLGGGALTQLDIVLRNTQLLDEPAAVTVASALRANSTLTGLRLGSVGLWRDAPAAALLLDALTRHPSVRKLELHNNRSEEAAQRVAAGRMLSALVAANAPALTSLDISNCQLGDAGLAPLVDALPSNTHLRTLRCAGNDFSVAFARDRLLPAARANAVLGKFDLVFQDA
jgi:hypothetical protein